MVVKILIENKQEMLDYFEDLPGQYLRVSHGIINSVVVAIDHDNKGAYYATFTEVPTKEEMQEIETWIVDNYDEVTSILEDLGYTL